MKNKILFFTDTTTKMNNVSTQKQPITMRIDKDTISYFKAMSKETGIPYQSLINLYLRDCANSQRKLTTEWVNDALGGQENIPI